ncbi:MAG: phosphoribosylglycinamide formyltransferase [Clostridiaceae bacterium]|nr:phosphoribosylglycinamide formyltransferase [Clostridiaceae bacterium]
MYKIAVLISGGGTNLQAIIDNIENGKLNCSIEAVIADNPKATGIQRAASRSIDTYILNRKELGDTLSDEVLKILDKKVDLIVLAGFLSILNGKLLKRFKNRIINIHPSLIPSFCGNGMYGIKVHEAAIDYGVKVSGCTVHMVDEGTDTGPILFQKTVQVTSEDSAKDLQNRILFEEHLALSEAIKKFSEGKILVIDRKVIIEE